MRGPELLCRGCRSGPPTSQRLRRKRGKTVIAAGQVRQDAINAGQIQPVHYFYGKVPQLIGFIKQGGKNQQSVVARFVEDQRGFLARATIRQRSSPLDETAQGQLSIDFASANASNPP